MTRETMLELLKAGVDPVRVSILKWKENRMVIEMVGIDPHWVSEFCYGKNCALCQVHSDCVGCCLCEELGETDSGKREYTSCADRESPWRKVIASLNNGEQERAIKRIDNLIGIMEEKEVEDGQ